MQDLESQDAVVESPDEAEAEIESSPEEQIEAVEEASTDEETEHLEVSEEAEPKAEEEPAEAAAPEDSPEPSKPEQPVVQPFSFAADGKRVVVEGASVIEHPGPDGNPTRSIVIPADVFQRKVQPYLADRGTFANKERDYKRQIDALSPDKNETVIRAQTLLDEFESVLSSEENLTQFLENFDRNRELLKLKVDKAATEAKLKARDETDRAQRTEQDSEATVQRVRADVDQVVPRAAEVLTTQYNVPVSPRALQAAQEEIAENLGAYYRQATQQDAEMYGVEVGEIVRDDDRVLRTIHRFASLLNNGSEQAQKTTEAAKKNAAALGTTKKPPPSVPAKGSPPPAKKEKEIASWEDFKREMGGHT